MSLDSKIHMIVICDYDTYVTNQVCTRNVISSEYTINEILT